MSNIPEARRLLLLIADEAGGTIATDIRHVVENFMTREKYVRKAPVKSRAITSDMAQRIRTVAALHPDMHLADIAARFDINPGRVSEILNHKR